MLLIPALLLAAFLSDAFIFRHRLAVEARTWQPILDGCNISEIRVSPSGRTTAYIVSDSWLDTFVSVYLSEGGLFPKYARIAVNPRNLKIGWDGPLFTGGDGVVSVGFDERDGRLYTGEWSTPEELSRYINATSKSGSR